MFTGIVEVKGRIFEAKKVGTNITFCIESPISHELNVDQSVSHNGVCLTVIRRKGNRHWVTAIDETLKKTNLAKLLPGSEVNLERCLKVDGRFDGHIVQGHVDLTAITKGIKKEEGSWLFDFAYENNEEILVDKGSVTVNGVSLTCFNTTYNSFRVAIIPYTFEHTNFGTIAIGDLVNIEFDIIGKYLKKLIERNNYS